MTSYIAAGPLVNYFFYKALGVSDPVGPNIPLDSGKIYFYADEDHSLPLNSWSAVIDPDNPVVNPWPLVLGGQGDCGVIYLEDRLYFIQIFSKDDILQWTINHFNPGGSTGGSENDALNYIPNGQFLLHNDLPVTDDYDAGEIRQAITDIAYGGWTFERPNTSTATDIVTFDRYDEYVSSPPGNPRYSVHINCTEADTADGYKRISVKFHNVNRFASPAQQYTVSFNGIDNGDTNTTVELYVRKNFGTDGNAEVSTLIKTFTLSATLQTFSIAFNYGTNAGKVIGPNNDDFVSLDFRLKTDDTVDVSLVDFLQESGNIINPVYPETPQRFDVKESLGGGFPIPAYDGSDLYLSPRLTVDGWEFDSSNIGKIYASSYAEIEKGELAADGSQYLTAGYSSDGIPYARLQKKWFEGPTTGLPIYGTGKNFVSTSYINGSPSASMIINNNGIGPATDFSDGTPATTFTFNNVTVGTNTVSWGLYYGGNTFFIWGKSTGSLNDIGIAAGTSGFSVAVIRNTALTKSIFSVQTVAAAGLAGLYFDFNSLPSSYRVWFKVDGAGSAPAAGGNDLLEIDLLSTWTSNEVAKVIALTISGSKITNVIAKIASAVPAGSYFNLHTASQDYYVWYRKDGVGTDPAIPGKLPILVDILSAYTAIQVSTVTLLAINSKYFAVPDLRGMFLRGADNGAGIDTDTAKRWSFYNQGIFGDVIGSFQFDEITQHNHTIPEASGAGVGGFLADQIADVFPTSYSGGAESRPLNTYVNYVIKY